MTKFLDLTAKESKIHLYVNIQVNIGYTHNSKPWFTFKFCNTNQEFNCQNIFKRESSKIANTYFFTSKNQARLSIFFFIPSKNQPRQQLLMKLNQDRDKSFDTKSLRSRISSKSCSSLSWIYQQLLIGSSSNYKLKLRGLNQNQNAWNEDDLQWKTI